MKNQELITAFIAKTLISGQTGSMRIDHNRLFSFNTVIAQFTYNEFGCNEQLIINITNYSKTTTTQQNKVIYTADVYRRKPIIVDGVSINSQSLI